MPDDENIALFGDRVERLATAHDARRRRGLAKLDREERVPGTWFPLGKILLVLAICVVLKALAIAHLSEGTYRTHLLYLNDGTTAERLLGAALAPDPLSLKLSRYLSL